MFQLVCNFILQFDWLKSKSPLSIFDISRGLCSVRVFLLALYFVMMPSKS